MNLTKTVIAFLLCCASACFCASEARAEKSPPDLSLTGHPNLILSMAFSPDAKRLASVGDDGSLKMWDLAAKKELFSITGMHNNANQVRFTPDGKAVVALGSESNVAVVNADSGKLVLSIPLENKVSGVTAIDLSPDGKTVAVVGRGSLRLFELASGKLTAEYEVHKGYGIGAVAYSADGKMLATAGTDNTANVIDLATAKVLQSVKLALNGEVVLFSADGKKLFVASTARTLQCFDIATGDGKKLIDNGTPILSLASSGDGKKLFVGGLGHGPSVVTVADGNVSESEYDCEDWIKSVAASSDGKWVAGGGNQGGIFLWKAGN